MNPTIRTEVLVCRDFDGNAARSVPDLEGLLRRLAHRITFDVGQLRNTEAHGWGFHYGFVSHIESGGR
jgi:hypothetical protein